MPPSHLGHLLRERRRYLRHTQAIAAAVLDISQSTLSRLERGQGDPFPYIVVLAAYLDLAVDEVRRHALDMAQSDALIADMAAEIESMQARIVTMEAALDRLLDADHQTNLESGKAQADAPIPK